MASAAVKITSKTHVKPTTSIGRKECQLVTFDLPYLAFYYNQKLLIYKSNGPFDFADVAGKIRESLGVVLGEFYQLAGKLGKDEEGVFRVEYDDSDADVEGVQVLEAVAEGVCVGDLTVEDGSGGALIKELIPYNGVLNLEGMHRPLLAVQLTKLEDGLAMGCAFNHAILDGTATWHFMSSWAEICSGKSTSVSNPPFLDRTKARNTRVKLDLSPPAPAAKSEEESAAAKPEGSQLREKVFKFSDSEVATIKSLVNSNPALAEGRKPLSTFQTLSVHIWRHVTMARELKPEDYTVFTVFADCRKRVDPAMADSYFGNLIQAIFTVLPAGMLISNPPGFGASMIQGVIEKHDAKAIEGRNSEWEAAPKIFQFKDAGVNCVAVGSSPRFKVYDVDFGFGKPESVRSGLNNRFDGMVYMYQGKNGGIDVEISLESAAMEKLEKDKEFLMEEVHCNLAA
uniref:Putative defective in cuticular ridge 1 n=1 Tax=Linum usitatissimum TaxID=4006 RepID=A0A172MLG3_LINUS|nr:putative defective in cuticular ridge 1 [Linum usitatissimum]